MKRPFLRASVYGRCAAALAILATSLLVAGCAVAPPATSQPMMEEAEPMADNMTVYGTALPDDALPYSQQVYRVPCSNTASTTTFDFAVSVYQRFCPGQILSDNFSDALVTLDKDFNVQPGAAESWSASEDGLTWTIKLRPGQQWSDGTPLTAHDYVATYRLAASPDHGWDFSWFYGFLGAGGIKNWNQVIAGELPVEDLGVTAVDDLTLQITTQNVFPPLPGVLKFSWPIAAHALAEHGPYYNSDPATAVSSGPFVLETFDPGNKITLVANPMYKGFRPPRIQRIEGIFMAPGTEFLAFQNDDIDNVQYEVLSPADFAIVLNDSVMSQNYLRHFGDFRTDYLLFDTFNPPFNSVDVRKAFAKSIDRDAIVENVFGTIRAMPATSMLMPGYPSSDTEGLLSNYQSYDCVAAQGHLADAGFADGEGFPAQEMWLRNESPALAAVFQAVAASISECLNINIEVSNKDGKVYMDALNAKPTELTLGAVSYGMDFLDPSNLLGIWVSSGRHSWLNSEFDQLVTEASSLVGEPELRDQMFRNAEEILVDDVGGVFIAHRWAGNLVQSWIQGEAIRKPDSQGISGFHWGDDSAISNLYLSTAKEE